MIAECYLLMSHYLSVHHMYYMATKIIFIVIVNVIFTPVSLLEQRRN